MNVRALEERDRAWLRDVLEREWGGVRVLSRGRLTEDASALPGLVAEEDGERVGYALLRREADDLEVVVLHAVGQSWRGAGTALLETVREEAARTGCRRAWLVTTNDNLDALRFYQRRGWEWVALHRDAVDRRIKPEIGAIGAYGIPIRHELEFEIRIGA